MLREFRDFLMRGNIVALAVAFVIGVAFAAVINSFVNDLVMPIIAMIFGKPDFSALTFTINDAVFRYGAFITALITFVAIAAAVFFFIVKPMDMRWRRGGRRASPRPIPDEERRHQELLAALSARSSELRADSGAGGSPPPRTGPRLDRTGPAGRDESASFRPHTARRPRLRSRQEEPEMSKLSRSSFLKTAGLATGAALVGGVPAAAAATESAPELVVQPSAAAARAARGVRARRRQGRGHDRVRPECSRSGRSHRGSAAPPAAPFAAWLAPWPRCCRFW